MKRQMKFFLAAFCAVSIVLSGSHIGKAETMPNSKWKKNVTGSAGVLEGKSVLVSIFVSDGESKWTKSKKAEANRKVDVACRYIKKQGKSYGKELELIADTNKNSDLSYEYKCPFRVTDSLKNQYRLCKKVGRFISKNIDLTKIRTEYETDSVGFLLHVNKSGVSSTEVHYANEPKSAFYECSTLFALYGKKSEGAATFAHEILHLFGARDLYSASQADGLSKGYIRYIKRRFSNEIMYTTYTKNNKTLKYKITNEVSRNTAYFLGWKDKIPELAKFAIPKMAEKGCFYTFTSLG